MREKRLHLLTFIIYIMYQSRTVDSVIAWPMSYWLKLIYSYYICFLVQTEVNQRVCRPWKNQADQGVNKKLMISPVDLNYVFGYQGGVQSVNPHAIWLSQCVLRSDHVHCTGFNYSNTTD